MVKRVCRVAGFIADTALRDRADKASGEKLPVIPRNESGAVTTG